MNDKTLYGHSRACGSAAYAVVILCMGKLIKHRGYGIPLLVSLALYALILGTGAGTQEAGSTPAEGVPRHSGKDLSFLKKRSYRMLCLFMLMLGMAAGPYQYLKILLLLNVGGDVSTQGLDSFCSCLIQVLVFYQGGRLIARVRPEKMLGGCAALVGGGLLAGILASHPWQIIAGSCLIQISYGLLVPTARVITAKYIPAENRTLSNSIVDAFYASVASTVSLSYAGALAENSGVPRMLSVCALFMAAAAAVAIRMNREEKKEEG